MTGAHTKRLILKSQFDEVEKLEEYINELQQWQGFDDDDYARIMLTLSEAATNAIVHGNREDSSKEVVIEASSNGSRLTVSVKDEGAGFNPDDLDDPLKKENLLNEGGRGVYLIKEYADELTFLEGGTKLKIAFNIK